MYDLVKMISLTLVIIGAINWGFVGVFNFDLVAFIFGQMTVLSRLVYSLVGLAGIIILIMAPNCYRKHRDEI